MLFADDLAVVTDTEEEMAWLADWDGEQGTKSQHRENKKEQKQTSKTAKARTTDRWKIQIFSEERGSEEVKKEEQRKQ